MNSLLKHAQDLAEAGQFDEAYRITDKSLKQDPDNPHWLNVMTHLMLETEKPSLGYQLARRVCDLSPKDSIGWLNLGVACRDMRLDKEAIRYFRRSLKHAQTPDKQSMANVNLSSSLIDIGEFSEAEGYCLQALEQNPESKKAVMNLAFCQLGQRNWKEGWRNYRSIIGHDWRPRFQYNDEPLWDGVSRGTIVLYGEQGLGDQISFASMLPDVMKWADENDSRIVVETVPRLVHLFRRSFPGLRVYGTLGQSNVDWSPEDREVNYSFPIGQVAEFFRTSDEDFPGTQYLEPDKERVLQWKALFESKEKPVIGLAWSSGVPKTGSRFRRVDLETLLPILKSVDAHWVSLQYKPAGKEISTFREDHPEIDLVEYPFSTLSGDYDDTVAMVAAMDQVVC
ncbi:MAG: hypothetical protein AAGE92_06720, partial [Cyanobacteria bacterium P01_G01_bin.4]